MNDGTIPHDPGQLLALAREAMARGQIDRAGPLFHALALTARDDAEALTACGNFCLRTGATPTAVYLFERAKSLRPDDVEGSNLLGYARLEAQEFAAARGDFEAVLAQAPGHVQANYGLGLCLHDEGRWSDAAAAFATALATADAANALPILLRLAECSDHAGDAAAARRHFEHAQRIAPDDPALLLAFGRFLRERGDAAHAMRVIDRCAQRHPNEPRLILEKARCLRLLGDVTHAARWLDRLEQLAPRNAEASAEVGECALALGDRAGAFAHWARAIDLWMAAGTHAPARALVERMLAIDARDPTAWFSRGNLARTQRDFEAAEAAWRAALEADPARLDAAAALALQLESTNDVAQAKALAEHAAALIAGARNRHGAIELLFVLAKTRRRSKDLPGALDALARIDALAPDEAQRMAAALEKGKLLDAQGDAAGAMDALGTGNAIAQARWLRAHPGRNRFSAGIDFMLDVMRSDWMGDWQPIADLPETTPVAFLIGFPRSGTTLLNQVLDGHPDIQAMEEQPPTSKITAGLRAMPRGYPRALADLDARDVQWLRDAYFRSAAVHGAPDRDRLVLDKFPTNTALAGMLHRVFPRARFVFALRHPCDVVLSCYMQHFEINDTMANFCTLADTVSLYTRTMDLWQAWRDALPLDVHTVRYEDVVDDFDGQVRALCAFLGVTWRDDLRDFSSKALVRGRINTPSYEQVSRPIYREARYRWERYRPHLEPYLPLLQPWIERFGYSEKGT